MNLYQFLSVVRARWWVAVLVFAVTVATTLVVSLLLLKKAPRYTATATLLVDIKVDPIAGMVFPGMGAPSYMATQVDVIKSNRVALRAVKLLKLDENPVIRAQWLESTGGVGNLDTWLANTFKKNLEAKPSRQSHVISVSYSAQDPRFSAEVANAFVKAFLDTTVELRVDPARQYSSFFETRAQALRDKMEDAQAKLSSFLRENGIVVKDERLDIETQRLNELSSQLVGLQALSAESSSRTVQANSASGDRLQEVLNNGVVATLKTDMSRAEARLQELNSRFGERHPQVVEAKASIAELRWRIDAEVRKVTSGVGVSNTINRSRVANVRASLNAQRSKVLRLKAQRDQAAVLQRDVEAAQRAYDGVIVRRSVSELESQATQTNISVLNAATPPGGVSFPNVLLNTLMSVVVGTFLAVGAALLVELIDRRVRTAIDLTEGLGLPLLGVLPGGHTRRRGLLAKRSMNTLQQRILGQLPSPAKGGA